MHQPLLSFCRNHGTSCLQVLNMLIDFFSVSECWRPKACDNAQLCTWDIVLPGWTLYQEGEVLKFIISLAIVQIFAQNRSAQKMQAF